MYKSNSFQQKNVGSEEYCSLITFQHRSVLNSILKDGKFVCDKVSFYNTRTPKCYKRLLDSIPNKPEEIKIPIFAWYAVLDSDNSKLTLDEKTIYRCLSMTGQDYKQYYVFKLTVPRNLVSLQNFYNFVDCRCEEEGDYQPEFDVWSGVFDIEHGREIQAVIPFIKKEWVDEVKSYEFYLDLKTYKFMCSLGNDVYIREIKLI